MHDKKYNGKDSRARLRKEDMYTFR